MMIVPDLTGVAKALKEAFNTTTSLPFSASPVNAPTQSLKALTRVRGRASALLQAAISADQGEIAIHQDPASIEDLEKRQTSVLIGVPLATTRTTTIKSTSNVVLTTTLNGLTLTSATSKVATVTKTVTGSATTSASGSGTTASASLTGTATAVASTPISTITAPLATSPATCPDASLDTFTDGTGIPYLIKCSTTNSGSAYELIKVNTGGYGQCFSSCSYRGDCVGFSFVGNDSGICYLRNLQSSDGDETALVSSYVTCYKVDAAAVATPTPAAKSGGSNVGAIAGGVVGGIAALVILLALIAFCTRRHRKKVDARREKRTIGGPMLPPQDNYYDGFQSTNTATVSGGGHHRSDSTANDIYGGSRRPFDTNKSADHFGKVTDPGARAQGGEGITKAGILRPPQELDSMSIRSVGSKPSIQKSGSRSSMFVEHMNYEMEDTSTFRSSPLSQESPILGHTSAQPDRVGDARRTHIMAWNRPDAGGDAPMSANLTPRTPPSARMKPTTSPDSNGRAREASFMVSPLRKDEKGQNSEASAPETLGSGVYKG